MPTGDFYIDARGLDEVVAALKASKGGAQDLRAAYRNIAEDAKRDVWRRAPVGSASRKDGRGRRAYHLRDTVRSGATIRGPWVSAGDAGTPDIFLHEFGGTSYWHRSGARAIRSTNRAHRSMLDAASRAGVKGHVVYKKPREPYGYFIWNVAYRLRSRIGRNIHENLSLVLGKHGIPYEMPANPDLGITPMSNPGRAA